MSVPVILSTVFKPRSISPACFASSYGIQTTWRKMSSCSYLDVNQRRLSYHRFVPASIDAANPPIGVVFFHGLFSNQGGSKALALEDICQKTSRPFVRFDFTACGESSGDPLDISMSIWKEDALAIMDNLTEGPVVLVGSSLGSWLMLLVALERRDRVKGMLGLASAPDFLLRRVAGLGKIEGFTFRYPDPVEGPYTLTKAMILDAHDHVVLKEDRLRVITCPVRLIHGQADDVVPFDVSLELAAKLSGSNDIDVILRKNGGHRLSEPGDLELLRRTISAFIQDLRE